MIHAFRNLLKSPGFTAIAILTLALGIGLNTAMFSLMNALLLQPLPYPEKDQLVRIYRTTPQTQTANHTAGDVVELQAAISGAKVAAYRLWSFSMVQGDRPAVNLNALRVSPEFFSIVGLKPQLGRYFLPEEDTPGNNVIVLSHPTWQAQFGGDPDVVGKTVRIDGEPMIIIGVTPAGFSSLFLWGPGEAFRPLALTDGERADVNDTGVAMVARLRDEKELGALNGQLGALAQRLAERRPSSRAGDGLRAVTLESTTRNSVTTGFTALLLGLALFVLLIACANLANLQLARTIARSQEYAVRSALGASRIRLLQPALIESLILAIAGGALGILVAVWTNDWVSSQFTNTANVRFEIGLDWKVLSFALCVSTLTGLLFGLVPAFVLSQVRVIDALKTGTRGNTGGRLQNRVRHTLIIGQFALALVLLSGAGLYVRGFERMLSREIGWNHHSLLQGVLNLPGTKYRTQEQAYAFYTRLQEQLKALPQVEDAAVGWTLPVFTFLTSHGFVVDGREPPAAGREPQAFVNAVTPSYIPTLKIRILAGRNFTDADTANSTPVAVISESMARALFPNENPLGRRIRYAETPDGWLEVVGIMSDLRFALSFAAPPTRFVVFRPLAQYTWNYVSFAVRAPNPAALADPVRRIVAELDPDLPVQQLSTVEEAVRINGGGIGLIAKLLVAFSALGLFLAALGLYGVITRLVTQRMPEIGVRVALGAQSFDVIGMIVKAGVRLAVIGTVVGLAGAFGLSRFLEYLAPELAVSDPLLVGAMGGLLFAIALIASWIPARRAARVDPVIALRAE